jgi:hypothetical protein
MGSGSRRGALDAERGEQRGERIQQVIAISAFVERVRPPRQGSPGSW